MKKQWQPIILKICKNNKEIAQFLSVLENFYRNFTSKKAWKLTTRIFLSFFFLNKTPQVASDSLLYLGTKFTSGTNEVIVNGSG